jgi:uroporphyrinogen-III synthase
MKRLVVLRPEPGASATVAAGREAGVEALSIPLFRVEALPWTAPAASEFDAMVLTSANAVRHGGPELEALRALPAYCVGAATAAAAEAAGLTIAGVGQGDAASLTRQIVGELRLLHLAGRNHRPIPGAASIAVYDNIAIDPPPALDGLAGAVAMVHSPRAGARLAELITERGEISIAALSAAAAEASGTGWQQVAVAARPDDAALLAVAGELCEDRGR